MSTPVHSASTPVAGDPATAIATKRSRRTTGTKTKRATKAATSKSAVTRRIGIAAQPLMVITWVPREQLHANGYNPNHVAPPEMKLLKISILEDGWTQPIVARHDNEIVDGFHRWTVAADPEIAEMTEGKVPVVFLSDDVSEEHQRMSTIRHNRARGSHSVLRMAEIVRDLIDVEHLTYEQVQERLQMDWEEVDRLYDRGGMLKRAAKDGFNNGWVPR